MGARQQPPDGVAVTRCFQRYSAEDRASCASSHRLGHRQRAALGEYFYVASNVPNTAFPTRGQAVRAAVEVTP